MKKLRIDNHPNSYQLTITDEAGNEEQYLYMNALDLANGIVIHAIDGYKDEVDLEVMRQAIYDHNAHQQLFNKQLANANSLLKQSNKQRDQYRKERDEHAREIIQLKKQLNKLTK